MERLGSAAGPQRMEAHGDGLLHQLPLAVTAPQVERRGFKVCPLHPASRQAQLSSARAVPRRPRGSVLGATDTFHAQPCPGVQPGGVLGLCLCFGGVLKNLEGSW